MTDVSALQQLPQLFGGALRLEPDVFTVLPGLPHAALLAWLIVLTAGLSESLGQSLILFLNRIPPREFVLSLFMVALFLTLSLLFWLLSTWGAAQLLFGVAVPMRTLALTLALACAPLCLSFFSVVPYFGVALFTLLNFWTLLAMATGLSVVSPLTARQSLLCIVLGWLFVQVFQRTLGRPVIALGRLMERLTVGVELKRDVRGLEQLVRSDVQTLRAVLEETMLEKTVPEKEHHDGRP